MTETESVRYELARTKRFKRRFRKLDGPVRERTEDALRLLQTNPHHPGLNTKKLQGFDLLSRCLAALPHGGAPVQIRLRCQQRVEILYTHNRKMTATHCFNGLCLPGAVLATFIVLGIRGWLVSQQTTKVELLRRIELLTPEQRGALFDKLSQRASGDPAEPLLAARSRGARVPASDAQRRLWLHERLWPGSNTYVIARAFRVTGPFDAGAFAGALDAVIARHEVLRTRFSQEADEIYQSLVGAGSVELRRDSLVGAPWDAQRAWLQAQADRPFDLEAGPVLRASIGQLSPDRHLLAICVHHIAADGWSMSNLFRELATLYESLVRGDEPALPALTVQYADYTMWQRDRLRAGLLDDSLAYWRARLSGARPELELPRPTDAGAADRGRRFVRRLDIRLLDTLRELGRRCDASLFMVLLAGFSALLSRYGGQHDVCIGTPVAGRMRSALEPLIGFFVNTLTLRCDLSGDPTFLEVVRRMRDETLGALAHQEIPFQRVVEACASTPGTPYGSMFQVMLALQNTPRHDLRLHGALLEPIELRPGAAKFDLTLSVTTRAAGGTARLEHRAAALSDAAARGVVRHLRCLLTSALAAPQRRISSLPMLSRGERRFLLSAWNPKRLAPAPPVSLFERFAEQAAARPDALAIRGTTCASVTYGEVLRRATRLAARLGALGVVAGDRVGLCLPRCPELVVGMLGILRAGGAYVPLDPEHPAERLAYMLERSGCRVIVASEGSRAELRGEGRTLVPVDVGPGEREPLADPCDAMPDALAYVMYTSGSTGSPKGVMVTHGAVLALTVGCDYAALGPGEVIAQLSNHSFDAATFEIWGALLNGGCIAFIAKDAVLEPSAFSRALATHRVSTMFLTTGLFNLVAELAPEAFRDRQVLFGGEAAEPRWVRRALQRGRPARLVHVYGPTETTTFASWFEVDTVSPDAESIPIGRPVCETVLHVLDRELEPLPIEVAGELHIGGPQVAIGYLGHRRLSAERFVEAPEGMPGGRLYRSGDRVRRRLDGEIEFLGRTDEQVKLRGFRVEPAEVSNALAAHPSVGQVLVTVHPDPNGAPALVAYVVPALAAPSRSELTGHLRGRLPEYMVPAAIVFLPALALTPNGKIDRSALPPPDWSRMMSADAHVEPSGATENALARIWRDLLGARAVGAEDSFFDLGGHSLLAARLLDRIETELGRTVSMDVLWFEAPTIRTLARVLDSERASRSSRAPVPIGPRGRAGGQALFCVHTIGEGNLFHYDELAKRLGVPVLGLPPRAIADGGPDATVEDMARHCVTVMRAAQPCGPYRLCGFSSAGVVALEIAQQLRAAGERVGALIVVDAMVPAFGSRLRTLRAAIDSVRGRRWRDLQERLYYAVLGRGGLGSLRRLRGLGEAHRWAYWSYQPRVYQGEALLVESRISSTRADAPHRVWTRICARLEHKVLDAPHGQLVRPPAVSELAAIIERYLECAPAPPATASHGPRLPVRAALDA